MKRLSTIFFFATVFCLTSVSVFAQNAIYLNADYKPATAANYTYKRVFKLKEEVINPNIGTGYYGGITVNPQSTGLYLCSTIDYYRTGEVALVGVIVAGDAGCTKRDGYGGSFVSQVIAYYKDGTIKRKEPWKNGKLDGMLIYYDSDGNETRREEYSNGKLIEQGKFSAPADSPIIGTWKYVECYQNPDCSVKDYGYGKIPPTIVRTAIFIYSQNGVVESRHENNLGIKEVIKGNWKYIAKTAASGVLEEYQGEELIERATVKWLSRNRLEYTITFSTNSDAVGRQTVWTRQ